MLRSIASLVLATSVVWAALAVAPGISVAQPTPPFRPGEQEFRRYTKEIDCLAEAIYFEARGEPWAGRKAVAQVVLNRVESSLYPDTVCTVVYQNADMPNACQFSFACDGRPETVDEPEAYQTAEKIAASGFDCDRDCRDGYGDLGRSTHYHAARIQPGWSQRLERTGRIGQHVFYYTDRI